MRRKGKGGVFILALCIISFALLFIGAVVLRYASNKPVSYLGGLIMAAAITLLAISRWMPRW